MGVESVVSNIMTPMVYAWQVVWFDNALTSQSKKCWQNNYDTDGVAGVSSALPFSHEALFPFIF